MIENVWVGGTKKMGEVNGIFSYYCPQFLPDALSTMFKKKSPGLSFEYSVNGYSSQGYTIRAYEYQRTRGTGVEPPNLLAARDEGTQHAQHKGLEWEPRALNMPNINGQSGSPCASQAIRPSTCPTETVRERRRFRWNLCLQFALDGKHDAPSDDTSPIGFP